VQFFMMAILIHIASSSMEWFFFLYILP
jgi:hypothetical protein